MRERRHHGRTATDGAGHTSARGSAVRGHATCGDTACGDATRRDATGCHACCTVTCRSGSGRRRAG
jgi:hypothetical protein